MVLFPELSKIDIITIVSEFIIEPATGNWVITKFVSQLSEVDIESI